MPAVHTQHHRVAWQVQHLLGGEEAGAAPRRAVHGQAGAIHLGERHLLPPCQLFAHGAGQHLLQRIGGQHITRYPATGAEWQAHLDHLQTGGAVGARQEVAAGIGRPVGPAGPGAGQGHVGMGHVAPRKFKHRRTVRGVGLGLHTHAGVAPLQVHQLPAFTQQAFGIHRPGRGGGLARMQGLHTLHIAHQRGTDVVRSIRHITLHAALHLAGLIPPGQPHQRAQHGQHQHQQQRPQRPAPPDGHELAGPATDPGRGEGGRRQVHGYTTRSGTTGAAERSGRSVAMATVMGSPPPSPHPSGHAR